MTRSNARFAFLDFATGLVALAVCALSFLVQPYSQIGFELASGVASPRARRRPAHGRRVRKPDRGSSNLQHAR